MKHQFTKSADRSINFNNNLRLTVEYNYIIKMSLA